MFSRWAEVGDILPPITVTSVTPSGATFVIATSGRVEPDGRVLANALVGRRAWLELGGVQYPVIANPQLRGGDLITATVSVPVGRPGPKVGPALLKGALPITIHAKITVVDDVWAMIASANCARRSLYTDFEHGVAFVDSTETSVRDLRARLGAECFRAPNAAQFQDLDKALNGWDAAWGTPGGISLPSREPVGLVPQVLDRVDLQQAATFRMTKKEQNHYNFFSDLDARESWGFVLPPDV